MSENAPVETQAADPLKTVADAMEHAVNAAKGKTPRRAGQGRPGSARGQPICFAVCVHHVLHPFLRDSMTIGASGPTIPKTTRSSTD